MERRWVRCPGLHPEPSLWHCTSGSNSARAICFSTCSACAQQVICQLSNKAWRTSCLQNELAILEMIHCLVETLDRYFSNVCELDLMFNLEMVSPSNLLRMVCARHPFSWDGMQSHPLDKAKSAAVNGVWQPLQELKDLIGMAIHNKSLLDQP